MDYSTYEDGSEDVEGYVDNKNDAILAAGVVDEVEANMKMRLKSHMSLINLKMKSGSHSQTRQGK